MTNESANGISSPSKPKASALSPFKYRVFTVLWCATLISNIGTWIHDVGAGWLMTELSSSPVMVAAVQSAGTLPIFFFALLAGAIADIVDRRLLLITANIIKTVVALTIAIFVWFDVMTPLLLLFLTFCLGSSTALMGPAWASIVPRLVERKDLPSAIALNSIGMNLSRAIGPVIAGALIVSAGIAWPFIVNAICLSVIIAALFWWQPAALPKSNHSSEKVGRAILTGLRYAANSWPIRATLLRGVAFVFFAAAYWAMLPLIAKEVLKGGATLYGVMLSSIGGGAVLGAFLLPAVRAKFGSSGTLVLGSVASAVSLFGFALVHDPAAAVVFSCFAGLSWIAALSSLQISVQLALPDWVRARGLSLFMMVFLGCIAFGSMLWGKIAAEFSIPMALLIAGIGAVISIPLTWFAKLGLGENMDFSLAVMGPVPTKPANVPSEGVIQIQVVYSVDADKQTAFEVAMRELKYMRKRVGASRWSCIKDVDNTTRFVETWRESSWSEHLRNRDRITVEDKRVQDEIKRLLASGTTPDISYS